MDPFASDAAEEVDALPMGEALGSDYTRSPFPLIADYAFLSDCESTCLIAPSGAVEWMCVPRPDSPSLFSAMLDRSAELSAGAVRRPVPRRAQVPPRQPDARDHVADTDRLADRARGARHGSMAQRGRPVPHAQTIAHRLRRGTLPDPDREVRQRHRRPGAVVRAGL